MTAYHENGQFPMYGIHDIQECMTISTLYHDTGDTVVNEALLQCVTFIYVLHWYLSNHKISDFLESACCVLWI